MRVAKGGSRYLDGWVTLTFRIKDLGVELRTKCSVRGGNSGVTNVGLWGLSGRNRKKGKP